MKLLLSIGLTIAVLTPGPAAADGSLPERLDADAESAAIASAERLGAVLFRHDRAAWVATDAAMKVRGFKRNKHLRGWITAERASGGIDVVFFGEDDDANLAEFYRVTVSDSDRVTGKPSTSSPPALLAGFELAAAKARMLAATAEFAPCGDRYNTVVIPVDDSAEKWFAYLMPSTQKSDVVPLGGTYRADIDLSSDDVQVRPYTKTCIALQNDPRAVGLMVTHLLDPVPTEVHVFWSMWADKPIFVATPPSGTIWKIEGPEISLVERRGPAS